MRGEGCRRRKGVISLRRRRRRVCRGQRRIDDLLSGLYNLGSCGKYELQQLPRTGTFSERHTQTHKRTHTHTRQHAKR